MFSQDWTPMILNNTQNTQKQNSKVLNTKNVTTDTETNADDKKIELLPHHICMQLSTARTAKKIKQGDLAKKLNIDVKIIKDIENNKYKKDMALAQRIAQTLGIKLKKSPS